MGHDHTGGVVFQRPADHLPGVNGGAVHGAVEHFFEADHPVLVIQEQHREHLAGLAAQFGGQQPRRRLRVVQAEAPLQLRGQVAPPHLQGGQHLGTAGIRHARQARHALGRQVQQPAQTAAAVENVAAHVDGGSAPAAGAQKDRQQFRVAERARAPPQQLFPGPFLFRPVADRHTHLPVFAHTLVLPYDAPSLHNPPGRGQTTSTMVCVSHSPKYCTG